MVSPVDGTPFGRYRLVEILGRGGMGEVWKAYDTAMNRVVALKVLPPNLADDAQYQARFRREAQAAASLDEPHIVPIHDFGVNKDDGPRKDGVAAAVVSTTSGTRASACSS